MTILNKSVISLIVLLSGCTLSDNLEQRYTKETLVPAHVRNSDVCFSLPIQSNETVVSAITYNIENPLEQVIFPSDKQPKSGLFCILPGEFKFKTGQEYLTQIEVNIRTDGEDKKNARKAYISTFKVVLKGDSFNIIQTVHK
ncbi:hypothetical protein FJU30_14805 [Affinibrenneria salicis]|uniref:DUF7480 domain-containing protein n=1 Tax=Affinibrenneria salicis TaxID=2590031 RepID=A0A5J5FYI0_9GAMM|nr:putative T6SS immunity periplasmic lipoprotein [Affinibrenneria salicis]KAA8998947.1 hypothetical protein FJU30_14805 [Affinibrenneria salicis]